MLAAMPSGSKNDYATYDFCALTILKSDTINKKVWECR